MSTKHSKPADLGFVSLVLKPAACIFLFGMAVLLFGMVDPHSLSASGAIVVAMWVSAGAAIFATTVAAFTASQTTQRRKGSGLIGLLLTAPMHSDLQGMSVAVEQAVRAMGGQGAQLAHMFRGLWEGTDVGRLLKKNKKLLEQGKPPEDLLKDINALGAEGGASEIAADFILAARIRGTVHHALQISNQLELEQLLLRLLRAAALTHAHVSSKEVIEAAPEELEK